MRKQKHLDLILKVQPTGSSYDYTYRLGLTLNDSKIYFKERGVIVNLILSKSIKLNVLTSCGVIDFSKESKSMLRKKSYDFNNRKIHDWIISNDFEKYEKGNPTKLLFQFDKSKMKLIFIDKL